eukprot:g47758.t1
MLEARVCRCEAGKAQEVRQHSRSRDGDERSRKGREVSEIVQVNLRVEGVGEVDELLEFLAGAQGGIDAVINITEEEEVGENKAEVVESKDQFSKANENVCGRGLVGPMGDEKVEGVEAFHMGDKGVQELCIHGEDEVLGSRELKVLGKVEGMSCVTDVGREYVDQRGMNGVK